MVTKEKSASIIGERGTGELKSVHLRFSPEAMRRVVDAGKRERETSVHRHAGVTTFLEDFVHRSFSSDRVEPSRSLIPREVLALAVREMTGTTRVDLRAQVARAALRLSGLLHRPLLGPSVLAHATKVAAQLVRHPDKFPLAVELMIFATAVPTGSPWHRKLLRLRTESDDVRAFFRHEWEAYVSPGPWGQVIAETQRLARRDAWDALAEYVIDHVEKWLVASKFTEVRRVVAYVTRTPSVARSPVGLALVAMCRPHRRYFPELGELEAVVRESLLRHVVAPDTLTPELTARLDAHVERLQKVYPLTPVTRSVVLRLWLDLASESAEEHMAMAEEFGAVVRPGLVAADDIHWTAATPAKPDAFLLTVPTAVLTAVTESLPLDFPLSWTDDRRDWGATLRGHETVLLTHHIVDPPGGDAIARAYPMDVLCAERRRRRGR